jgi:hypothetical protein
MNRFSTLAALVTLTASLAGCGNAPAATTAPAAVVPTTIDAVGHIAIDDGGYVLQALTAWNKTNVTKVTLHLYRKTGGSFVSTGVTKDVANSALASAVSLENLKLATEYKVVANAYDSANARIDNQAQSDSDADCSVTFTTPSVVAHATGDTVDDSVLTFTVPVKLMNKTFAGQAKSGSGVTVTNGGITSTSAGESF